MKNHTMIDSGSLMLLLLTLFVVSLEGCSNSKEISVEPVEEVTRQTTKKNYTSSSSTGDEKEKCNITDSYDIDKPYVNYTKQSYLAPMYVNVSGGMFFNNQDRKNDLKGQLQGSVMLAQTSIFPSRPPTDTLDKRPHLVSLRDTLVLFDPISSNFDETSGVKIAILSKSGNVVYDSQMSPPEQLPNVAERIGGKADEFKFLEAVRSDFEIDSTCDLKALRCGKISFESIFTRSSFIRGKISDYNWVDKMKIPENLKPNCKIRILLLQSKATMSTIIRYNDQDTILKKGTKFALVNINGKWINIYEAAFTYDNTIRSFLMNNTVLHNIDTKDLGNLKADFSGTKIRDQLKRVGNIKLIKSTVFKSRYNPKFFLPRNDSENNGKLVFITSIVDQNSLIDYGNPYRGGVKRLSKNRIYAFYNKNGMWVEWADALFGAIYYGDNFWSIRIPKEYIIPGISFNFKNKNINGKLLEVEVGARTELLMHTIDIGMLVEPINKFKFQTNLRCQKDYFQGIPVSRLIINQYAPIHLTEIVLPNNATYINASSDEGNFYEGDLRGTIAKALISGGINLANYGIHSTVGVGPVRLSNSFYRAVSQFTIHNSRGRYQNGIIVHGFSGGGTVITVTPKTCAPMNVELGHEIGHNWLDHYPGGFKGSVHHSSNYFGSSWGWNSEENTFIPNFERPVTGKEASLCDDKTKICQVQGPFFGHKFGADPMSLAMSLNKPTYSSIQYFTLHTPYALWRIQNSGSRRTKGLERSAIFDRNSATGMSKWNSTCKCMKPWKAEPNDNKTDYPKKPKEQGIPVTTMVGYYDPDGAFRSYIYPPLHAAYGNVFPQTKNNIIQKIAKTGCFATIIMKGGTKMKYLLTSYRLDEENMNKFHINIATKSNPKSIFITCKGEILARRQIAKQTMDLSFNVFGLPL